MEILQWILLVFWMLYGAYWVDKNNLAGVIWAIFMTMFVIFDILKLI